MRRFLVIGLILGIINCSFSQNRLAEVKSIKKTFLKTEIRDLQLLYDFFNQTICNSDKDLNDCYDVFSKKVKQEADSGLINLHIPFKQQQKVYQQFEDSTFDEIWAFGKASTPDSPNISRLEVYFRSDGNFMKFLKKASKKDEFIKVYYESVKAAGEPTPSLILGVIENYDKLNIYDTKVKFVIAIHYLTVNDQSKRRN